MRKTMVLVVLALAIVVAGACGKKKKKDAAATPPAETKDQAQPAPTDMPAVGGAAPGSADGMTGEGGTGSAVGSGSAPGSAQPATRMPSDDGGEVKGGS